MAKLPEQTCLEQPDAQTRFVVRPAKQDAIIVDEIFHRKIYDHAALPWRHDATVVDIGGHIGVFAVYAAQRTKRVFSYEPSRENFTMLTTNLSQNRIANVTAFNLAVSGQPGHATFYLNDANSFGHSLLVPTGTPVTVQTTSLQEIFAQNHIDTCHLLKIDAEGAEEAILAQTPQATLDRVGAVVLEYHNFIHPDDVFRLTRILSRAGFAIRHLRWIAFDIGLLFAERTPPRLAHHWRNTCYVRSTYYWNNLVLHITREYCISLMARFLQKRCPCLYRRLKRT